MTTSISLTSTIESIQHSANEIQNSRLSDLVLNGFAVPDSILSKCDGFYSSVNLISFIKKTFQFLTSDHRLTITTIDIAGDELIGNSSFLEISNTTTGSSYSYVLLRDCVNNDGRFKMHSLDA